MEDVFVEEGRRDVEVGGKGCCRDCKRGGGGGDGCGIREGEFGGGVGVVVEGWVGAVGSEGETRSVAGGVGVFAIGGSRASRGVRGAGGYGYDCEFAGTGGMVDYQDLPGEEGAEDYGSRRGGEGDCEAGVRGGAC